MSRTPEELAEIKTKLVNMLADGMTRPQMAERLGVNLNQVGGLINRLINGYKSPKQHIAAKMKAEIEGVEFVPPASGARQRPSQPVTLEALPIVVTGLSFEPPEGKVNIWNVKVCQCRWIGDDGFFCAEATGAATNSYCPDHAKRLYIKPQPKVRKKSCFYQPKVSELFA